MLQQPVVAPEIPLLIGKVDPAVEVATVDAEIITETPKVTLITGIAGEMLRNLIMRKVPVRAQSLITEVTMTIVAIVVMMTRVVITSQVDVTDLVVIHAGTSQYRGLIRTTESHYHHQTFLPHKKIVVKAGMHMAHAILAGMTRTERTLLAVVADLTLSGWRVDNVMKRSVRNASVTENGIGIAS